MAALYSRGPCAFSFDQVSADNNHAHTIMFKSHVNKIGRLNF